MPRFVDITEIDGEKSRRSSFQVILNLIRTSRPSRIVCAYNCSKSACSKITILNHKRIRSMINKGWYVTIIMKLDEFYPNLNNMARTIKILESTEPFGGPQTIKD